ncbi:MAG: hypothetical protein LBI79_10085 [Nitrososphaerota archaeon]|jgi:uncharacterized membrane protein|nr:hypothetical protein [Nitrososphaerota archaeon]
MPLKNEPKLLVGTLTLVLGLSLGLLFGGISFMGVPIFCFLSGLFFGLSIVMNISYLMSRRQKLVQEQTFQQ